MTIEEKDGALLVRVRVQPKASRDAVSVTAEGQVRVALTAPPVEGAANKALCTFLAGELGVGKRCVSVKSGAKSREKTLRVEGIGIETARERLGL